ncbi:claudin-34 [Octodon degus]|uniref:Claudin-34 n=1 Tax=Octodon degus TaxID=10160 RepID=A0A6P3ETM0_OCTDE|nr:claudin-34 [Octodon degus]
MTVEVQSANRQVAGFAIITIAWIFSSTSMGLVEWRVCHMDDPSFSLSSVVCVGMWRFCVYSHDSNFSKAKRCHQYRNTFLPADIRTAQHLLLAASALGFLGKACAILGLRNVHLRTPEEDGARKPFIMAGTLTIAACACLSIAAFWNCYSVMNEERIYFPLSFHVPFQPGSQEMGSTMVVALLSAFLLLLSGIFFLSYRYPLKTQEFELALRPEKQS